MSHPILASWRTKRRGRYTPAAPSGGKKYGIMMTDFMTNYGLMDSKLGFYLGMAVHAPIGALSFHRLGDGETELPSKQDCKESTDPPTPTSFLPTTLTHPHGRIDCQTGSIISPYQSDTTMHKFDG